MANFQRGDKVTLRNVCEFSDPMDWGMDQVEYDWLVEAQEEGHTLIVTGEETDGYFNLVDFETGLQYAGVCEYHLKKVS